MTASDARDLPIEVQEYVAELAGRLRNELTDNLVAVYLHGSSVLGGFNPDRNDIDVLVVVAEELARELRQRLIDQLLGDSLPCPATSLELAVVRLASIQHPTAEPEFELLIQNGKVAPERVKAVGPLILVFAECRMHGELIGTGPPAMSTIAEVPAQLVLREMRAQVSDKTRRPGEAVTYRVLNACRAWRYVETGEFSSKIGGGRWAQTRSPDHAAMIETALTYQEHRGAAPIDDADPHLSDLFSDLVTEKIDEALNQLPS
jgi:streptomycin 3"-adenylyltransferase